MRAPAAPPADSVSPERGPARDAALPAGRAAVGRGRRAASPASAAAEPSLPAAAAAGAVSWPPAAGPALSKLPPDPPFDPEPDDEVDPEVDDDSPPLPPLAAEADDPRALAEGARVPRAGRHGLAVLEAARRPDFDLVTVFDGCLSQVDGESHWESFRFGAASLQRGPQRRRLTVLRLAATAAACGPSQASLPLVSLRPALAFRLAALVAPDACFAGGRRLF